MIFDICCQKLLDNYTDWFCYELVNAQALKESEEKYRLQLADATKREAVLLKSLTEKERETNDLAVCIFY